jgi:hypothetical protein
MKTLLTIQKSPRERVVVSLTDFGKKRSIDLRKHAPYLPDGGWGPTRMGVRIELKDLPALVKSLHTVEAAARKAGFIGADQEPAEVP